MPDLPRLEGGQSAPDRIGPALISDEAEAFVRDFHAIKAETRDRNPARQRAIRQERPAPLPSTGTAPASRAAKPR